MRRVFFAALGAVLCSVSLSAQIPLDQATIVGSPDVRSYPITARLDAFGLSGASMTIQTSGTEAWPSVPCCGGTEPAQAGTLWIVLNIHDGWYATGAERLRPAQLHGEKPEGDPATLVGEGWLYDAGRWGPMAGYNPQPGEHVGLMVVAGSSRSEDNAPLHARTDLIEYVWPNGPIVWREGQPATTDTHQSDPPVVVTPPVGPDLSALVAKLDALQQQQKDDTAQILAAIADLKKSALDGVKQLAGYLPLILGGKGK